MTKSQWLIPCLLALAACGSKESSAPDDGLRSDMPARTTAYYMQNKGDLDRDDAICTSWKSSQRPPASWPAVVVSNCNSVGTAKTMLLNKADTEKLRRETGI